MRRKLILVTLAAVFAAACGGGGGGGGGAGPGTQSSQGGAPRATGTAGKSQKADLMAAATGTWTGMFGTLTFNPSGPAKFELKNCGTTPGQDPLQVASDCAPTVTTGTIQAEDHDYLLSQPDGSGTTLQAYVDGDKKLHVGVGTVGELGADRKGSVRLQFPFVTLIVGDTCQVQDSSSGITQATKCRFETRRGLQVLVFDAPDPFNKGQTQEQILVYFPDLGLVVAPEVYASVFSRS
jgi:hypothetical protein